MTSPSPSLPPSSLSPSPSLFAYSSHLPFQDALVNAPLSSILTLSSPASLSSLNEPSSSSSSAVPLFLHSLLPPSLSLSSLHKKITSRHLTLTSNEKVVAEGRKKRARRLWEERRQMKDSALTQEEKDALVEQRLAKRRKRETKLREEGKAGLKRRRDKSKGRGVVMKVKERKEKGLFWVKGSGLTFATLKERVHSLWWDYARRVLFDQQLNSLPLWTRLLKLDFHGALIEVKRSRCPSFVGVHGICVQETQEVVRFMTEKDEWKTVPKQGTVFSFTIEDRDLQAESLPSRTSAPMSHDSTLSTDVSSSTLPQQHLTDVPSPSSINPSKKSISSLTCEIYGTQIRFRASERTVKKFKTKPNICLTPWKLIAGEVPFIKLTRVWLVSNSHLTFINRSLNENFACDHYNMKNY